MPMLQHAESVLVCYVDDDDDDDDDELGDDGPLKQFHGDYDLNVCCEPHFCESIEKTVQKTCLMTYYCMIQRSSRTRISMVYYRHCDTVV
jgi:hypothetical protein